ncbi:uncharacterized protein LOC112572278 [Pomacea canaliculata]|uniref:uncharacterized protein LOC112572278 n=1 Tax=Pomacea canaliculata TaxID=400727 RepID=UPI000D72B8E7|nr:uncharacterized protein LOC112572278 [Pomacea canaliculata]
MASDSKLKFGKSVKDRLDALACPYVEDADEAWVTELVFTPGEPRIRLLQWLLSKFDTKAGELLDTQHSFAETKMDSRIQKILYITSSLGLCRYNDVDLIRGMESASGRQAAFFNRLLDIVTICDMAEDPKTKHMITPGTVSSSRSLEEQLNADTRFIDTLASSHLSECMVTPTIDLIPPDLQRLMPVDSPQPPSFESLLVTCRKVEESIKRQLDVLVKLHERPAYESGQMQLAGRTLSIVLHELGQLTLSFTLSCETHLRPWCNRPQPQLSHLGPTLKRVHGLQQKFFQLLMSLHQIRQTCTSLSQDDISKDIKSSRYTELFEEASQAAAKTFQKCVEVLEVSVQRQNQSPSTSLCSSFVKS